MGYTHSLTPYYRYLFTLWWIAFWGKASTACSPYQAMVIVPVADVTGEHVVHHAHGLPVCPGSLNKHHSCPRLHQLLLHEQVVVLETKGEEALVAMPHIFFTSVHNATPKNTGWVTLKNLRPCNKIPGFKKQLPPPLDYTTEDPFTTQQEVVALTEPWYTPLLKVTLSAGTRFIRSPSHDSPTQYAVYAYDAHTMNTIQMLLPRRICATFTKKSPTEQIKAYVKLVRQWVHDYDNQYIPYVWGGCSLGGYQQGTFHAHQGYYAGKGPTSWYSIAGDTSEVKTGFDCSGLMVRATQLCGIPFFLKNSTSMAHYLDQLTPETPLAEGDIIMVKGHVMLVSNLAHNLLIEARGYDHGYGKLHEIPLAHVFQGITTYQDLVNAFFYKKPLVRLDAKGQTRETYEQWRLLRLASVWHVHPRYTTT